MQIEIKIDPLYDEPKVVVLTASMTEEVHSLVEKLSEKNPSVISGIRDGMITILEEDNLIKIYAGNGKVFAVTDHGEYSIKLRLYEIEKRLDSQRFVRISNSEIVNLKKVKNFDLSFTGIICVELINNTVTYVSRRYVSKIKKILGI